MDIKYYNKKDEEIATMTITNAMDKVLKTMVDVIEWGRMCATENATTMRIWTGTNCSSVAIKI